MKDITINVLQAIEKFILVKEFIQIHYNITDGSINSLSSDQLCVFISAPAPPAPAAPVVTVRQEIQDGAGHSTVFINDSQTNVSRDS